MLGVTIKNLLTADPHGRNPQQNRACWKNRQRNWSYIWGFTYLWQSPAWLQWIYIGNSFSVHPAKQSGSTARQARLWWTESIRPTPFIKYFAGSQCTEGSPAFWCQSACRGSKSVRNRGQKHPWYLCWVRHRRHLWKREKSNLYPFTKGLSHKIQKNRICPPSGYRWNPLFWIDY